MTVAAHCNKTILVIEDEFSIRSMLRYALERAGFSVCEAEDAQMAQAAMAEKVPDLILLDWMLPKVSGVLLAKRLKESRYTHNIPIIMLTAKAEEVNKVEGLEAGADDYIVKPFSPRELIARIRAVLRRGPMEVAEQPCAVRELVLEPSSQRVTIDGGAIKLGPLEFRLLHFFMLHPDRVFSRGALLTHVWKDHADNVDERTVDVHIRRLRKQLKPHQHDTLIQTVHGAGYRFSKDT